MREALSDLVNAVSAWLDAITPDEQEAAEKLVMAAHQRAKELLNG